MALLRFAIAATLCLTTVRASHARPFRPSQIPNGALNGCANCHVSPLGGGPRNVFGQSVESGFLSAPGGAGNVQWGPALAALDADGDGFTNGGELQDPDGTWQVGQAQPGAAELVSLPGDPADTPPAPPEPLLPVATLSSATLVFGSVELGLSRDRTLTVGNSGNAVLSITGVTSSDPDFAVTAMAIDLSPQQSADLVVIFTPSTVGAASGSLTLEHNDSAGPTVVALTGTGVDPFTVPPATPVPLAIGGATIDDKTPTVDWEDANGATSYVVEYAVHPGFVGSDVATGIIESQFTFPTLADGTVYWRVKACNSAGESSYSTADQFVVIPLFGIWTVLGLAFLMVAAALRATQHVASDGPPSSARDAGALN